MQIQSKIQWLISMVQDATSFQVEVAAILYCETNCLRKKKLAKEQTVICTDSQRVAVASVGASGTKSLLVTYCIKKLTALSEVNQVTIIQIPRHSGI